MTASPRVDWSLAVDELVPHFEPFAASQLSAWAARRPEAVVPLKSAVTERIYGLKPSDVAPYLRPPMAEWPFREGVRKAAWALPEIEDLTGGLPLALGFHRYVEAHGHVPSWTEAVRWFSHSDQVPIFLGPAWEYRSGLPEGDRQPRDRWKKAITWRIGNAYLSFVREMDFLSRMIHDHGVRLRMHILVDAVVKIDFWYGRHAVCAYIQNDVKQRKASPEPSTGIVHDACIGDRSMWTVENGIRRKLAWNEIKQASERELARIATAIREDRASAPEAAAA